MKAVILTAGKGTRCLPLTKTTPKVLIPINGRPFLSYLLQNLQEAGFSEFGIIVGHLKEKISDFAKENNKNSAEFSNCDCIQNNSSRDICNHNKINATLIEQAEQLGTGHALAQAEKFANGEDFLLISGDNLYSAADIKEIANSAPNVVAGFAVQNPERYGVLELDGTKLKQIAEKPKVPKSNLVNTGLYKFSKEIFAALKQIKKSASGEYYLTDAINVLARQNKVEVKKLKDYWIDLGRLGDIPVVERKLSGLF